MKVEREGERASKQASSLVCKSAAQKSAILPGFLRHLDEGFDLGCDECLNILGQRVPVLVSTLLQLWCCCRCCFILGFGRRSSRCFCCCCCIAFRRQAVPRNPVPRDRASRRSSPGSAPSPSSPSLLRDSRFTPDIFLGRHFPFLSLFSVILRFCRIPS